MAIDSSVRRPLIGLATVLAVVAVIAVAVGLFRGSFTKTVPVTVLSHRAGLVMNADAKVKLHGAQVGSVHSIEALPDGRAAIHLAMDPSYMDIIPSDVRVDIASSTVFGSKFVELVPPADPSAQPLQPGQVLNAEHVTVEINTVFEQLSSVLARIEPAKLNQTLGALATAFDGRGDQLGQMMADVDGLLAEIEPSLPVMEHELAVAPQVIGTYADVAQELVDTVEAATTISQTVIDEQGNLDSLLVSVIGLSDNGIEVVGGNRQAITDVMELKSSLYRA